MAFNIVDKDDNHLGIVFGRLVIKKGLLKSESGTIWGAGLTSRKVEDLGFSIYEIEKELAKRWKLGNEYGSTNKKFVDKLKSMEKTLKVEGLNYEELLRYILMWFNWKKVKEEVEKQALFNGYIFVDPKNATYKNNKIVIDFPQVKNDFPSFNGLRPFISKIVEFPEVKFEHYFRDRYVINYYTTKFVVSSGGATIDINAPYCINGAKIGDIVLLYYDNSSIIGACINGTIYNLEEDNKGFFKF